jgi:hypothetical protein
LRYHHVGSINRSWQLLNQVLLKLAQAMLKMDKPNRPATKETIGLYNDDYPRTCS